MNVHTAPPVSNTATGLYSSGAAFFSVDKLDDIFLLIFYVHEHSASSANISRGQLDLKEAPIESSERKIKKNLWDKCHKLTLG